MSSKCMYIIVCKVCRFQVNDVNVYACSTEVKLTIYLKKKEKKISIIISEPICERDIIAKVVFQLVRNFVL